MTNHFRKAVAAALALAGLLAMNAADAQRARGGGGGAAVVSGGQFRGAPGRSWQGGTWVNTGRGNWHGGAWVGTGRPWGWGPGWGASWRPGWGPGWSWAGWGPGWGWGWGGWGGGWNAWGWSPAVWGWSTSVPVVVAAPATGAWVLPSSAQPQAWIERPAEDAPPAAAAGQWWYWCASAQAYFPYVQNCAEGWRRVSPQVPAGVN